MFGKSIAAEKFEVQGGFAGAGASTDASGPDGIVGATGMNTLYVGDVDSVKIVDTSAMNTVETMQIRAYSA
jgi:hypothetical protein